MTKVVFKGNFGACPWVNVMWLFLSGSGEVTHSDLLSLANSVADIYAEDLLPQLSADSFLNSVQLQFWGGGEPQSAAVGVGAGGSKTTAITPGNVAACVSWAISPSYSGGHPRTYLCGVVLADILNSQLFEPTFVGDLTSAANAFHEDIESIDPPGSGITEVEHGVVSFQRNLEWREPPVFYRIQGAIVDSRIDTQRRRLGRDL
jgi:hypothetical protein